MKPTRPGKSWNPFREEPRWIRIGPFPFTYAINGEAANALTSAASTSEPREGSTMPKENSTPPAAVLEPLVLDQRMGLTLLNQFRPFWYYVVGVQRKMWLYDQYRRRMYAHDHWRM